MPDSALALPYVLICKPFAILRWCWICDGVSTFKSRTPFRFNVENWWAMLMLDDLNLLILAWQIHLPNPIQKTTCKSHILSPEVNMICPPVRCLSYGSEFQKILHTSEVKEWHFQFS
jgi:hypothetical protein